MKECNETATATDSHNEEDTLLNDFKKVIDDLKRDIKTSFPELKDKLDCITLNTIDEIKNLYDYCNVIFPERFFDIIYQNADIWADENINTNFLPNIDFAYMMNDKNITEKTIMIIWKYLQLMLFAVIKNVTTKDKFKDTAKLFEAINEDELKSKLQDTVEKLQYLYENKDSFNEFMAQNEDENECENENENECENENEDECGNKNSKDNAFKDFLNPDELHSHISQLLEGKIGLLAKDIADKLAGELDIDLNNSENSKEEVMKLFKSPDKLLKLVKDVGSQLDEKIKSGDLKESELLEEATNIMSKMKDMPGISNVKDLLNKMGMPNMPNMPGVNGKSKFNKNAFNDYLEKQMRSSKLKEKLKKKQEQNANESNVWGDGMGINKTTIEEAQKKAEQALQELLKEEQQTKVKPKKNKKKKNKKKQ